MSRLDNIAPEDVVADLFAAEYTSYDNSGNGWFHEITGNGNVIEIAITPSDDDGVETDETFHFRAVVVEAPSFKVSLAPVELYSELARELTYTSPGKTHGGWTVVAVEDYDSGRWESHHQLVIRNEAGHHYAAYFSKGLTEYQDTRPWEGETTATFTPVAPTFRVVTEWKSVDAAQAEQERTP